MGALLQRACVVALSLIAAISSADAEPRERAATRAQGAFLRSALRSARGKPVIARAPAVPRVQAAPRGHEVAGRRPRSGSELLCRVLGARVQLAPDARPVAELDEQWVELKPPPKRPFRPKYMLDVMSFPTGGSGIKLKVRY